MKNKKKRLQIFLFWLGFLCSFLLYNNQCWSAEPLWKFKDIKTIKETSGTVMYLLSLNRADSTGGSSFAIDELEIEEIMRHFNVTNPEGLIGKEFYGSSPDLALMQMAEQIETKIDWSAQKGDLDTISGQRAIDIVKAKDKNEGVEIEDMIYYASFQNDPPHLSGKYKIIPHGNDKVSVPENDEHPERHRKGFWEITGTLKNKPPCKNNDFGCKHGWGIPIYRVNKKTGDISGPMMVQ